MGKVGGQGHVYSQRHHKRVQLDGDNDILQVAQPPHECLLFEEDRARHDESGSQQCHSQRSLPVNSNSLIKNLQCSQYAHTVIPAEQWAQVILELGVPLLVVHDL